MDLANENETDADGALRIVALGFDAFIRDFLVSSRSSSVRAAAAAAARAAWRSSKPKSKERETIANALFSILPSLTPYGDAAAEAMDLARWLLARDDEEGVGASAAMSSDVVEAFTDATIRAIQTLSSHDNAPAYASLRDVVDLSGGQYWLETAPGLARASLCGGGGDADDASAEPFRRTKIDTSRAEMRFTERAIVSKLLNRSLVKSVIVNIHNPGRTIQIRRLAIYRTTSVAAEVSRLRSDRSTWKKVATATIAPGATEAVVDLPTPLIFAGCVVELTAFHVNLHARAQEILQCPRCSRHVTDKHGVCRHCRENAHQCRHCRNINYEHPNAFVCNECGHSKHARIEITLECKPAGGYPRVRSEEEAAKAVAELEAESATAARARDAVAALKPQL
jgi:E3 ubiquitin-protein ligase UBR4